MQRKSVIMLKTTHKLKLSSFNTKCHKIDLWSYRNWWHSRRNKCATKTWDKLRRCSSSSSSSSSSSLFFLSQLLFELQQSFSCAFVFPTVNRLLLHRHKYSNNQLYSQTEWQPNIKKKQHKAMKVKLSITTTPTFYQYSE